MICHPTANFLGHYALPGLAERGFGAIGFTTRYVGNDTSLLMENCLLDMGTMVDHLYASGYARVVLVGNSGGASIVPYYQAQAVAPTVTSPPGGGPDLTAAGLRPADAIVLLNAHPSRARLSTEWLDPAITDEQRPFDREPSLDMFHPDRAVPFAPEFVARYRAAQVARNRRISGWCEEPSRLAGVVRRGTRRARRPGIRRARDGRRPALPRRHHRSQRPRRRRDAVGPARGGQLPARRHQPRVDVPLVAQPVVARPHQRRFAALAASDHGAGAGGAGHRRSDRAAEHGAADVRRRLVVAATPTSTTCRGRPTTSRTSPSCSPRRWTSSPPGSTT